MHGSEILRTTINQGRFGPSKRMRSVTGSIQPYLPYPGTNNSGVLPRYRWDEARTLLGNRACSGDTPAQVIQLLTASRVGSVISNGNLCTAGILLAGGCGLRRG
jgi:hypothetical protein